MIDLASSARLVLAFAAIFALTNQLGMPAEAEDDYAYRPVPGVICTGGNVRGLTVGAWLLSAQPRAYALLAETDRSFLNNVYEGTTCTQTADSRVQGRAPLPPPGTYDQTIAGDVAPLPTDAGVDPSGSFGTTPFGSCPPGMGGCITAMTIFSNTIGFGFNSYTAEVILELESYDNASGTWTGQVYNFYNNHGSSWLMSVSTGAFNRGDHWSYWTDVFGTGDYVWLSAGPIDTANNFFGEVVHMGQRADLFIRFADGATASATYCFSADYEARNAAVIRGGWCVSQP